MPRTCADYACRKKEEIIDACAALYEKKSFKEITLKDISEATSLSRPSIYNYFINKEEIFLALLTREYKCWNADLERMMEQEPDLNACGFASRLAESLARREQLLRILSMNHYDLESSSRPEALVELKMAFKKTFELCDQTLQLYVSSMSCEERSQFLYAFFPFMFGVYAYAHVTDKQKFAMKQAGMEFRYLSTEQLISGCIRSLLSLQDC